MISIDADLCRTKCNHTFNFYLLLFNFSLTPPAA